MGGGMGGMGGMGMGMGMDPSMMGGYGMGGMGGMGMGGMGMGGMGMGGMGGMDQWGGGYGGSGGNGGYGGGNGGYGGGSGGGGGGGGYGKGGGKGKGGGRGNGPRHDTTKTEGKLFVGGLSPETSKESLDAYACQFGNIADSVVMPGRGFGFLTFSEPSASATFMNHPGGHIIDGKQVQMKEAQPKTKEEVEAQQHIRENYGYSGLLMAGGPGSKKMMNRLNPPATKLFCGGVGDTSDEDFRSYWQQYGELDDCAIVRDASGKSRGFGFVTFKEMAAVEWALSNPHHSIHDKVCEVKRAVPKLDGPGPSPGPVGTEQYQGYDAATGEYTGNMEQGGFKGGSSGGALLPGDWMCQACGNKNFARRAVCNRCRAPRQDDGYAADGGHGQRYAPY